MAPPQVRRPRSFGLDGLAIGAPLTAAFVGAMLAEDGHAASPGQDAESEVVGARDRQDATPGSGAGEVAGLPRIEAAAGEAAAGGGASGARQDALDASASAPAAGAVGPLAESGDGGGQASAGASEVAAGVSSQTDGGGGINVGVTLVSLDDGQTGEGAATDGGAGTGTIGDYVTGSDGDDVIDGTPGDDVIHGGDGDDVLQGHAGDDLLDGGDGDDELLGGPGEDTLLGGNGDDDLLGGTGDDDLFGGNGNDELFGQAGDDLLDGGAGDDLVDGGAGADQMQGGTGDDVLVLDHLHDVPLDNTPGPDGGGADTLRVDDGFSASQAAVGFPEDVTFVFSEHLFDPRPAGTESFTQQVAPGIENVVLTGSADHDVLGDSAANRIVGNDGDNMIFGRGGDDLLSGGAGADWLDGGAGSDRLEGGSGDDILNGGDAADLLYGSAGDDVLDGGFGQDQLYGGAGNDTFMIGLNDSAVDTVFDHEGVNVLSFKGFAGGDVQAALQGDDLHLSVDNDVVAVIDGYRGHESAFSGIDLGDGPVAIADLLAPSTSTTAALSAAGGEDLLGGYLSSASLEGGTGGDWLTGTAGADWLSGRGGDDHLAGGAGKDVLEGGAGSDLLEGGAGADRYLFGPDDGGPDTIRDAEGPNVAEVHGVAGARLEGAVVGDDLQVSVAADHAPLFTVENFVGHEDAFAGVETDDGFVPTDDLFGS